MHDYPRQNSHDPPESAGRPASLVGVLSGGISLSAILRGFPSYLRILREVASKRSRFLDDRPVETETFWKDGALFLAYAVFISFLLLVPAFVYSGTIIDKWAYVVRLVILYLYFGMFLHIGLKIVGGKGSLRQTLGAYFFLCGLYLNLHVVLAYPALLRFGPEIMFGRIPPDLDPFDPIWLSVQTLLLVASVLLAVLYLQWFSRVHGIGKLRVLAGLVLVAVPASLLYLFVMVPLGSVVGGAVQRVMEFF